MFGRCLVDVSSTLGWFMASVRRVCCWIGDVIGSIVAISEVILYYAEVVLGNLFEIDKKSPKHICQNRIAQFIGLEHMLNECVCIWKCQIWREPHETVFWIVSQQLSFCRKRTCFFQKAHANNNKIGHCQATATPSSELRKNIKKWLFTKTPPEIHIIAVIEATCLLTPLAPPIQSMSHTFLKIKFWDKMYTIQKIILQYRISYVRN